MGTNSQSELPAESDQTTKSAWYGPADSPHQPQASIDPAYRPLQIEAFCTVREPMNTHGGLTLESVTDYRTYNVVEYATPAVGAVLAQLRKDAAAVVQLVALADRGDTWRAVGVRVDD